MKYVSIACIAVSLMVGMPFAVDAARFDLKIVTDVKVTPAAPLVATPVKLYVTVDNVGADDVEGTVIFRDGDAIIGQKPISVRSAGIPEEVWLNWTPKTTGNHFIDIRVVNDLEYPEATPNDNVMTKTIFVDQDTDRDGIPDSADPDMDNDGLSNTHEASIGTNPLLADTDGDGVKDGDDYYPLDPKRWNKEVIKPAPVVTAPVQVAPKPQTITPTVSKTTVVVPTVAPVSATVVPSDVQSSSTEASVSLTASMTSSTVIATSTSVVVTVATATDAVSGTEVPQAAPVQQTDHERETGSNALVIGLWSVAGILALVTAGTFVIAKRKEEE